MKKMLVTGGAGFIGSHLVDRLVEEGYKVIVADDLSRGRLENVNAKADFKKTDITSKKFPELIKKIRPDVIFHFAAQSSITKSIKNPKEDIAINILATQDLLDGAKETKLGKVIFASSASVYAQSAKQPIEEEYPKGPLSLYGVSKLCSEYLLSNYRKIHGLSYASLRFANVYGLRQDSSGEGGVVAIFIDKILKSDKVTIFGNGTQTRDFIYVDDVVDACLSAVNDDVIGEFNIGTESETSVLDLYSKLLKISGSRSDKIFRTAPNLEVKRSALSFQKYKKKTNWRPRINLGYGLEKTFNHFKIFK